MEIRKTAVLYYSAIVPLAGALVLAADRPPASLGQVTHALFEVGGEYRSSM